MDLWQCELELAAGRVVGGIDEAGRGSLAGPVVAAAVVLQGDPELWAGVDDSKRRTRRQRQNLYERINRQALAVGVGVASVEEIDHLNILQASRLAMARAAEQVKQCWPGFTWLVDGNDVPTFLPQGTKAIAVVGGDARCLSIAAASIVAKVYRDGLLVALDKVYPEYGFLHHMGYGTSAHLAALRQHGPSPVHRRSFRPVRQWSQSTLGLL
ncbi:ribonuclease HII [Alicyclobacillaceae bacterium I2511]|nr:ribonuclease HII [Alicyclobacillaceae bacterium I2511]